MITSVILDKSAKASKTFPLIKRKKGPSGFVVLFTGPSTGTVIAVTDETKWSLGQHRVDWDDIQFEVFVGDVVLTSSND